MISKQMIDWGESGCSIREIAAYGERRAAEIGPANVYNFAIGNPSIDPPDCVHAAVERLLRTVPPTQLHAYAPAPGMASVRANTKFAWLGSTVKPSSVRAAMVSARVVWMAVQQRRK